MEVQLQANCKLAVLLFLRWTQALVEGKIAMLLVKAMNQKLSKAPKKVITA